MPLDEALRVTQSAATITDLPQLVRQVAVAALVAFVLGRTVAPALHGASEGLDQIIVYADRIGDFAAYLFAFAGIVTAILELTYTFRERRFSALYRFASTSLGVCVISLLPAAFLEPLPERASLAAALASASIALLASREAIAVPRTRALGVLLAAAGIAALLHIGAAWLAWYAGEHGLYRMGVLARMLATGSVLFDTLALVTAFAWLTTREDKATVWAARAALFLACVMAFGAARGERDGAPLWQLIASRSIERLTPSPPPLIWQPFAWVLEACAPLLGIATVAARGQLPALVGSLTLALIARPSTDIPLSALALTLAALSAPLAARDDRGMWAVLMAKPR